jgi:oligopeptidase B
MPTPPIAKKHAEKLTIHGDTRTDDYFWMRLSDDQKEAKKPDAQTQDVLDYLHAENAYLNQVMEPSDQLRQKLYDEMVARIKQDDQSVPVTRNGYSYYERFEAGADYSLVCRKKMDENATEEIILNGPEMGNNQAYFDIGSYAVSPDNNLLAYSVDWVSRREYVIYIKDLRTGTEFKDKIKDTEGDPVWANDNKTIFYTKKDPVTLRSNQIYRHEIGTSQAKDVLVYEEKDETFSCYIFKTKSDRFLIIHNFSTVSSEVLFLDASTPEGEWTTFEKRARDHEYNVTHAGDYFYIITNTDGAKNFKLMRTPLTSTSRSNWEEVIPHRADVLLEGMEAFKDYFVLSERKDGLNQIRVLRWDKTDDHYIGFQDPAYSAYVGENPDYDTEMLRFHYTSLTTPGSVYAYDMRSKERSLLKQQEIMDPKFSIDNYTSERVFAKAADGTLIPMSIVYRKGTALDGSAPLLLYGYGSYGYSMDAYFSSSRLSLLDRGFIFVIAHIRGGQEMGREWYENGKLLKKKNTFTDFIDCAEYLIAQNYTSKAHLYAMGGSAGGLLMGAVTNMRPDLWNGIIADVPFVDVISTMLDETIPLTTGEFDEWGNPKNKEYYEYMLSYSPYDQVEAKDYPHMMITTGYWDSQVQYWEPAKWAAKLRALKTDQHTLVLYCNMDVGHGGASGRFEALKETALQYAFLFSLENIYE